MKKQLTIESLMASGSGTRTPIVPCVHYAFGEEASHFLVRYQSLVEYKCSVSLFVDYGLVMESDPFR